MPWGALGYELKSYATQARDKIENPIMSTLFHYDVMKQTLTHLAKSGAQRHVVYMGRFGFTSLKPLELFTTIPEWAMNGFMVCSKKEAKNVLSYTAMIMPTFLKQLCEVKVYNKKKGARSKRKSMKAGRRVFFGARSLLKQSSAYEHRFGVAFSNMLIAVRSDDLPVEQR